MSPALESPPAMNTLDIPQRRPHARTAAVARAAAWLGAYAGVVTWLTWPLGAHLATHLPNPHIICRFDQPQMIWALSHLSRRLFSDPLRLFDAGIYHPMPHALLYAEAGFGALPFFMPTFLATGDPTLAANVMFLGSLALGAWGLHLLLARWTGVTAAGVVAACTFLLTPWMLWMWAPGPLNYGVLQYVPPILWLTASDRLGWRRAVVLGLLVALQGATSPYVAAGILAPIGVLTASRLLSPKRRASGVALAGALAIAVTLLLAVYGGYAWVRWHEPGIVRQTWWPGGFFRVFKIPEDLFFSRHRPNVVPLVMFPLIALGAAVAWWRASGWSRAWRHGALWTGVGLLVSLPPTLGGLGDPIPLPHAMLFAQTPLLDLMREPQRMAIAALFGLAAMAGAAYGELWRALETPFRTRTAVMRMALLATVLYAAHYTYVSITWPLELFGGRLLPARYPIKEASYPSPAIVRAIRSGDGAVLQIPAHGRTIIDTITANAQAMRDSIPYDRPLVNGYGGYYPAGFRETIRLAARLPDPAALAELRARTGLSWILVRGATTAPEQRDPFELLARVGGGLGLRFVVRDGDDLLFAVE